jgi:hypothetical protein
MTPKRPAADPAKQAEYDRFVENGMRMVYGNKQGIKALLKSLDGNGQPVTGLANTVTLLAQRLAASAQKAGKPLSAEVVLHGSGELLEQLADFSKESGGYTYQDEELAQIGQHMVKGIQAGPPKKGAAPPGAPPPATPAAAPATPELMPARGAHAP